MLPDVTWVTDAPNLESARRKAIDKPTDTPMVSDFAETTKLYRKDKNITDITPFANLTNLASLNLADNSITDWSPVARIGYVHGRP